MDILIADDHNVVIAGLKGALEQAFDGACFSLASDSTEVFRLLAEKSDHDLALVDLNMPGMDGFEFLGRLCTEFPALKVGVISGIEDPHSIKKAIALGALGFIPKSVTEETLINAVRLMLRGDIYLPTHVLKTGNGNNDNQVIPDSAIDVKHAYETLTERQRQITLLLGEGQSNKDIARQLDLSENTIKVHVSGVLRALNLRNRTQVGVIGEKMRRIISLNKS